MIGARITTMRARGTSSARAAALIGRNIPSPITGRALPSSHSPSGFVTRGGRPTRSGAIPATPASSAAWSSQCVSWPRWVLASSDPEAPWRVGPGRPGGRLARRGSTTTSLTFSSTHYFPRSGQTSPSPSALCLVLSWTRVDLKGAPRGQRRLRARLATVRKLLAILTSSMPAPVRSKCDYVVLIWQCCPGGASV